MVVEVKIKPGRNSIRATRRFLVKTRRRINNPSAANRKVSIRLLRWVNENFKTEGGKVGKWKPFRHGGRLTGNRLPSGRFEVDRSAKLLQDTGALRASFIPFSSKTVAGIGSNVRYSLTHELGLPHKNVPIRRMLPLPEDREVIDFITKIYDHHIQRTIRK